MKGENFPDINSNVDLVVCLVLLVALGNFAGPRS